MPSPEPPSPGRAGNIAAKPVRHPLLVPLRHGRLGRAISCNMMSVPMERLAQAMTGRDQGGVEVPRNLLSDETALCHASLGRTVRRQKDDIPSAEPISLAIAACPNDIPAGHSRIA